MAVVRRRLDVELTRRGLAESREAARRLVVEGRVLVDSQVTTKPAHMVLASAAVLVRPAPGGVDYVSRGAHKLIGALDHFEAAGLRPVGDRSCLDAGASTGGFTDVLLRRGAARVIAADVGYGQLAWPLRQDERVTVLERCNVRHLSLAELPYQPDLVVADLSFISLRLVLPSLTAVVAPAGDLVLLVKPQFEVGRESLGRGGVVRDPQLWRDAVSGVAEAAAALGWPAVAECRSPLPGPAGNVEFFLWLRHPPAPTPAT